MVRKLLLVVLLSLVVLFASAGCNPAGQAIEPVVPPPDTATQTPEPPAEPATSPTPEPFQAELDWRIVPNHFLPNAPFVVNFTRPVNPTSSPAPLFIEPAIEGNFSWNETATSLTFTPTDEWTASDVYTIVLDGALMSNNGESLAEVSTWHILIAARPQLIGRTPADIALATDRRPQITLIFDQPMDQTSMLAALTVSPATELELTWQENNLTIQPLTPLQPGLNYSFTLAETATNVEGIALAGPYHWSYRLNKLVERATWPSPTRPEPIITVYFNYPVDPTSVNLLLNPPVSGENSWNDDYTILTHTLTEGLMGGNQYTINLADGLRDSQGQLLPTPYLGSFRTPDVISRVSPVANAQVNPFSTVQVTFAQAMDPVSTEAAFTMVPNVPGRLEWHGNMLEFHPESAYLPPETDYQVTIDTTALNAQGQAILSQSFSWTFSTTAYEASITFGEGEQSQLLAADGPRMVQFAFGPGELPAPTHFELFPLELAHWLEDDLHGHEAIATWDEAPTPVEENEYIHVQQTAIPAGVPTGLYLLQMSVDDLNQANLVVFISRYTLVAKQDADKVLVWLSGLDGTVPAGVPVSLYTANGQLVSTQPSDRNGFVTFGLLPGDPQNWKIVARPDNDLTAVVLDGGWQLGYANLWKPGYLAHLSTDRNLYYPGQTIYFRAIVRWDDDQLPEMVPAGTPLTVHLWQGSHQWNGEIAQSQQLTTNNFGTTNGHFDLPNDLPAGAYRLELVVGEKTFSRLFTIVEQTADDIQLFVSTDAGRYASGQDMEVSVLVLDSNGQPVANHYVTLSQRESVQSDCYNSYGYYDLWFIVNESQISGQTDSSGRFTATIPAQYSCGGYDDISGQRVVRAIQVMVRQGEQSYGHVAFVEIVRQAERLDLAFDNRLQIANVPVTIVADVLDLSDQGVGNRQISLSLARYETNLQGFNVESPVATDTLTSDGSGRINHNLTIDRPGYYQLTLSGRDVFGNSYAVEKAFYVYSPAYNGFYGPFTSLSIESDRDSYEVGEIGRLIIRSDFDGPALLTFSRGLLHRQQLVTLTSPMTLVEVPFFSGDAPNLNVTVHAWQPQSSTDYKWSSLPDAVLKTASTTLTVVDPTKNLTITVSGLEGDVPAGSQTNLTIRVTDSAGNPVQAELSLSLVNQLLLDNYINQPLPVACAFYAPRLVELPTYHSLAPIRYLDAWGGCGCGGDGWWGEETTLVTSFSEGGLWLPNLYTDGNGEVTITITLPVPAGAWQLSLQAITTNTQIGQSDLIIITQ